MTKEQLFNEVFEGTKRVLQYVKDENLDKKEWQNIDEDELAEMEAKGAMVRLPSLFIIENIETLYYSFNYQIKYSDSLKEYFIATSVTICTKDESIFKIGKTILTGIKKSF